MWTYGLIELVKATDRFLGHPRSGIDCVIETVVKGEWKCIPFRVKSGLPGVALEGRRCLSTSPAVFA